MTNIVSKSVNFSITDALRAAIEDSFSPLLDNFESLIVEDIVVTVDSKQGQSTERSIVKVRVPVRGNDVFVEETGNDMYKTIEQAASVATRLMRKHKQKFNHKGSETIRGYQVTEE